ncbi:MAG: ABC transporter permease, partial [Candidatus Tectomicrobia bacterium]|nr:ABC transporter permease [Candidatus Tectomicrobia bacterium]
MKFLPLVWSNLKRKKARTLLTFLSIVVAFILYGYLSAIGEALTLGLSVAGADRLIVRNRVSIIQPLPLSYRDRIASVLGVEAVTHASWFGGIYQDPKNVFGQMAVPPQTYLDMYPEFVLPKAAKEAWLRTRTGAIVGRRTAEKYGWKIGDRIPLQATIWPQKNDNPLWEFDLVGIYDGAEAGTDLTNLFFHYDYFDEARQFGQGLVGWYMVRVRDP